MIELTDTELSSKRGYISLDLDYKNKVVAYFNFQKVGIRMDLVRGNLKSDGSTSRNYFTIDDPKKLAQIQDWTYKSGTKGAVYKISINKDTDVDYIMFLIKQKYKNLRQ